MIEVLTMNRIVNPVVKSTEKSNEVRIRNRQKNTKVPHTSCQVVVYCLRPIDMIQLLLPRGSAVWCTANPLGLAYHRLESWSRSVSIPETVFNKSCAMKIGLTLYGLLLRSSLHFSLLDVFLPGLHLPENGNQPASY